MNPQNPQNSDKLEKQLDLIQVNESISILNFKLQILGEKIESNQHLLGETLDDLSKMYSIQKNLTEELFT